MSAETQFTEVALDILDRDALSLIFKRLPPKSVLKLCQVSKKFAKYCNDRMFWIMMMKEHYPEFQLTDDPRAQYQALTNDHITTYYVEGETLGDLQEVAYLNPVNLNEEGDLKIWEIPVKGLPFKNGTGLWISYDLYILTQATSGQEEHEIRVYNTQSEAINDVLDIMFDVFLDEFRNYADETYGNLDENTINQVAQDLGAPTPVTREKWYEWLMNHDEIYVEYGATTLMIGVAMMRFEK